VRDKVLLPAGRPLAAPDAWFNRDGNQLRICAEDRLTQVLSDHICTLIGEVLNRKEYAVITVSSGRTFRPAYALIRDRYSAAVDWRRVICVQMDEYAGLAPNDGRSLASEISRELVTPLGVGKLIQFYAGDGGTSLDSYEETIRELGGLDCALHGVGRNGHVGFNEPGSSPTSQTRVVSLTESTRTANGVKFEQGVTLGLSVLRDARASVIALRGREKRSAAAALLYGQVSSDWPVTYLRDCKRVSVFLDQEATPTLANEIAGGKMWGDDPM
jgi:6-phosphogluconolactonase/glucosamine-6-phosphate isomerase/deaminase